jgi:hypothetical protein
MNREQIIQMAREAGIDPESDTLCNYDGWTDTLVDFAAIVAAAEREACAKVCEDMLRMKRYERNFAFIDAASAIRARGQA